MSWANTGWWLLYAVAAVSLQASMPGLDFLLPGLIVALQERRLFQTLSVGLCFLLMQEGMGSMAFGGIFLWYGVAVLAYQFACSLFQGSSFVFVFLLSCLLSAARYVIFAMVATLQDMPWDSSILLGDCALQVVLTPCVWLAASSLRGGLAHEAGQ